jgi:hypothetical protein
VTLFKQQPAASLETTIFLPWCIFPHSTYHPVIHHVFFFFILITYFCLMTGRMLWRGKKLFIAVSPEQCQAQTRYLTNMTLKWILHFYQINKWKALLDLRRITKELSKNAVLQYLWNLTKT